jgi:MFS family permease
LRLSTDVHHDPPAAVPAICGLAPSVGASALGLIGLGNAAGSYVVGLLGARYSQKRLLALISLLRALAIAVYLAAPISAASTLVFAAAMGFLWLSVAPLVSGLIGRMFGLRHFNTLFGLTFLSHQVGPSPAGGCASPSISQDPTPPPGQR